MRHQNKTIKLGRTAEHRNALLANQACSLIEHGRIKTTLAKAKAVRPLAEKMITSPSATTSTPVVTRPRSCVTTANASNSP